MKIFVTLHFPNADFSRQNEAGISKQRADRDYFSFKDVEVVCVGEDAG